MWLPHLILHLVGYWLAFLASVLACFLLSFNSKCMSKSVEADNGIPSWTRVIMANSTILKTSYIYILLWQLTVYAREPKHGDVDLIRHLETTNKTLTPAVSFKQRSSAVRDMRGGNTTTFVFMTFLCDGEFSGKSRFDCIVNSPNPFDNIHFSAWDTCRSNGRRSDITVYRLHRW